MPNLISVFFTFLFFLAVNSVDSHNKISRPEFCATSDGESCEGEPMRTGDQPSLIPHVIWMAPFFSGGGYCSEAISFVMALREHTTVQIVQHGDSFSSEFIQGLDDRTQQALTEMSYSTVWPSESVVICHSEPGAWNPPRWPTTLCPPPGALWKIGRTMFETDRLPKQWDERINKMDQVWVPTHFHAEVFEKGGVDTKKIVVMPEPVDVEFYSPCLEKEPYRLPNADPDSFKFLSIFKWEERKGWKFLLNAFLEEFTSEDNVQLFILTNAYHTEADFQERINEFINDEGLDVENLPPLHLLPSGIPTENMPSVYKAADAFVLPSRGEGWGRPHVEAMSMALPVIATFWSGPTEYMTEENSYPLSIDGVEEIKTGAFRGHFWAIPSVNHLRQLMREVVSNREDATTRGIQARKDMTENYCPNCVAKRVVEELVKSVPPILVSASQQDGERTVKEDLVDLPV